MAKVTVIIPNYDGLHFLKDCLNALKEQEYKDFKIIVVDNGSVDGSVEYLKENYPSIELIEFKENTGFCHAINAGVKKAETPYVLLLNNDTIPDKRFVGELVKGIDGKKDVFSCSSCMLMIQDNTLLDGAGDLYNALGWAFAIGKEEKAVKYNKPAKIFSACAGAAIYQTEVFKSLGMLDEVHFAYLEDMDLGWRARLKGYKNIYIPTAKVVHVGSGTTGGRHSDFKVKMSARNNLYMIRKNMPKGQRILNAPLLFAGRAIKYVYFKKKGFSKAYMQGLKEGRALKAEAPKNIPFKILLGIQLELMANLFRRRR